MPSLSRAQAAPANLALGAVATAGSSGSAQSVGFKQHIGANEGLRTGSYATTLTFRLSTTSP